MNAQRLTRKINKLTKSLIIVYIELQHKETKLFYVNDLHFLQMNHPDAQVFVQDGSHILDELLKSDKSSQFPRKGEVELICSGPPCQGYSGMNTSPDSENAQVNNSMVAVCLSYLDFYR
jgi:hypothetical protein